MGSELNTDQIEATLATPYDQHNNNQYTMDAYNSGSMYGTPNYGTNCMHNNPSNEYKESNIESTDSGNFIINGYNDGNMYYQSPPYPPPPPRGRGRGWRGRGWRGAIHHYGGYMYDHSHNH